MNIIKKTTTWLFSPNTRHGCLEWHMTKWLNSGFWGIVGFYMIVIIVSTCIIWGLILLLSILN